MRSHLVSQWVYDILDKDGVPALLDIYINATRPYTPAHFYEEVQGMADGLEGAIPYQTILQVALV